MKTGGNDFLDSFCMQILRIYTDESLKFFIENNTKNK